MRSMDNIVIGILSMMRSDEKLNARNAHMRYVAGPSSDEYDAKI